MANEMLEGLGITQAELNDWLKEPKKKKKEKPKESEVARKAREEGQRQAMALTGEMKKRFTDYKTPEYGEADKPGLMERGLAYAKEKFPTLRSQADVEAGLQKKAKLEGEGLTDSWRQDMRDPRDPRIVEQTTGRMEDLGSEALPVVQAMERGQRAEEEVEKKRLELGMRKQNFMTEGDREKYGASPSVTNESALQEKSRKERGGEGFSWGEPTAGGLGELPPSVRDKFQAPGSGGEIDKERVASINQGDIEQQMVEGMDKDQEILKPGDVTTEEDERAVNEEFIFNASEDEQEEAITQVSEAMGPFAEETVAIKEATGQFVRYDGATKKGITINKTRLKQLYDQKGKMALLQHVPQENRAALMFNWGLISEKDLSDTQQQSAKEVLELEKIGLQIAELKNNAGNSTTKMSDQQKAEVTAASNGLAAAVKERRWDEAEGFQTQLNELMPDRKPLNIEKMQQGIDKKLLERPKLQKVKGLMGTQVWDGYFTFKNDLVKKIDLLKVSKAGSGDLAAFLGGTAQAGENKGRTWSDILEGQGVPSWSTVDGMDKNSAKAKQIASRISGGKHEDITRISRGKYMGHVLPQMRQMIMKEQYGNWYTTIEKELHGAQAEATAEAQESVNSDGVQKPEPASPEAVVETTPKKLQSAIPEPPANAQGGPMATVPAPVEEEQVESTEADMIQLAEQNEVQRQKELAEQARIEKEGEELYPKWKLSKKQEDNLGGEKKKEYNRFKKWAPKLLEKSKNDPEFLQNLKEKYKESVKRKKAKGKNHYWEDYNLAYIKMLLNK